MSSSNRSVVITGVSGGIGRATTLLFAASGWRVIGLDRDEFDYTIPFMTQDEFTPAALRKAARR